MTGRYVHGSSEKNCVGGWGTGGGGIFVCLFVFCTNLTGGELMLYSRLQKSCNKQAEPRKTTIDLLCLNMQRGRAC